MVLLGKLVEDRLFLLHLKLFLHLSEFRRLVCLSPYDIELAATALAVGVHLVAKACCTQGATFVEIFGIYKFGRNGIVGTSRAEHLSLRCSFAIGVSALYHKVLNDTVEERAVEVAFFGKLQEVVTVFGRLVVEAYKNVAFGSLDSDLCHNIFF